MLLLSHAYLSNNARPPHRRKGRTSFRLAAFVLCLASATPTMAFSRSSHPLVSRPRSTVNRSIFPVSEIEALEIVDILPKSSSQKLNGKNQLDSVEKLQRDVDYVMNVLRPNHTDPTIPALYRNRKPTFTNIWGQDDWEIHTSRKRYMRYLFGFPTSRLLWRTLPQMSFLLVWSLSAAVLCSRNFTPVARLHIGLTSMSLISTFIAALLTLRSNQSLQRLQDCRNAFGKVILDTREMGHLIGSAVYPDHPQEALLAARHVALFPWALKAHARGTSNHDIVSALLPNVSDSSYISSYPRKAPAAILLRLRHIMHVVATSAQNPIEKETYKALLHTTYHLNEALMVIERVRNSPIPPIYTAHTTRLLLFYLLCLPLALYETLHNAFATVCLTLAAGYAMLGLDEISHILELPFKLMPLRQLSKMAMLDSTDGLIHRPPQL